VIHLGGCRAKLPYDSSGDSLRSDVTPSGYRGGRRALDNKAIQKENGTRGKLLKSDVTELSLKKAHVAVRFVDEK